MIQVGVLGFTFAFIGHVDQGDRNVLELGPERR
jgi:hypothetical protein